MAKQGKIEYTPNETASYIKDFVKANEELLARGLNPIALSIEGEAGIGKTTIVSETAALAGYNFLKLNMAQFQEPADFLN